MLLVPYSVDRPPRQVPYVTYTLIALNVLVFLVTIHTANQYLPQDQALVEQELRELIPPNLRSYEGPVDAQIEQLLAARIEERRHDYAFLWRLQHLDADYAFEPHYTTAAVYGLVPRNPTIPGFLLTHMFLHAGLMHLVGNMLFLFLFGRPLEDAMGRWFFAVSYLIGGVSAATLHHIMTMKFSADSANLPMFGASGAVSCLMGMFALRFYRTRIHVFYFFVFFFILWRWGTFTIASAWGIGLWIAQDVVGGLLDLTSDAAGGVAHWAHLGGFGFGLVYGLLISSTSEGKKEYKLDEAEQAFHRQSFGTAARIAGEVLTRSPHDHEAHFLRGCSLARDGDQEAALNHVAAAISIALRADKPQLAGEYYRESSKYVSHFSLDPRVHLNLAGRLARAGQLFVRDFSAIRTLDVPCPECGYLNPIPFPPSGWDLYPCAQCKKPLKE